MTRIDLLPGAHSAGPAGCVRKKLVLRKRKPLTKAELEHFFDRIKERILKGVRVQNKLTEEWETDRSPFGVFVMKSKRGGKMRDIRLLSIKDPNYEAQLRVDEAQQHYIATYDGRASLGDVLEHLSTFDRELPR
ncbi:hypothetical protein D8I24_6508 [Cupriavidus necator H850]|uniref:hypothetical protein n=1 Tax=Cupriavidus necator TaxID=106590 RepID=UPI00129D9D4F|nr:hypothetical protein [Cupriavidus necator]KAI3597692.1 hypothetical protein D8I24_6508 [Cupriavidus necator H850]